MSKISSAITEIHRIEDLQKRDQWLNRIHPLVKLACTCFYIVCLVSFNPYDILGVLSMGLYPLILFMAGDLSITDCLRRVRIVLPLVCLIGIFNPIFDRAPMLLFGFAVRAGFVSMLTLIMKGVFAVLASYVLIASTSIENICYALSILHLPGISTSIENICYALSILHLPGILITEILLIYRYVGLLLAETERITQAYSLRAPGQKGVHFKVWGSLAGQMLLRSMDRANDVFASMSLRGYSSDFRYLKSGIRWRAFDLLYLAVWCCAFLFLRNFPLSGAAYFCFSGTSRFLKWWDRCLSE